MKQRDGEPVGVQRRKAQMRDAGRTLFLEKGLAQTRMEEVAQRAGVAKGTLYKYFPDKERLFTAVVADVFVTLRQAVEEADTAASDPLEAVGAILVAKHKQIDRILADSPHAHELTHAANQTLSNGQVSDWGALETDVLTRLTAHIAALGHVNPSALARLVMACAEGIRTKAVNRAEIGPAIRLVVAKLLG